MIEIIQTYSSSESDGNQLDAAIRAMSRAKRNVEGVIRAFKRKRKPLKWAVNEVAGTPKESRPR